MLPTKKQRKKQRKKQTNKSRENNTPSPYRGRGKNNKMKISELKSAYDGSIQTPMTQKILGIFK